jgi:hypothetical protein
MAKVKVTAASPDSSPRAVENHQWPTVNIVTTKTGDTASHDQVTGSVGVGTKQFYASGGNVPGLKTIFIAGYSAPG